MPRYEYQFIAAGEADVEKAFIGIEKAALRTGRAINASLASTVRFRKEGGATARAGVSGQAAQDRQVNATARLAARVASDKERAAKRVAATEEREAKRSAQAQTRVEQRLTREREKNLSYVARIRDRHFRDQQRQGEANDRTDRRYQQRVANLRGRSTERLAKSRQDKISRFGGHAKDMALGGAAAAGAIGLGLVGGAARDSLRLREMTRRLAIAGRGAGQKMTDPGALQREFEATAMGTPGISAEGVAAGTQAFVTKTGRLDVARQMQGTFATTASATGSNVEDIAGAAADLFEKFDIKTIDEMRQAFATLSFQGKKGAFELKDAAGQYAKLAAAAQRFGLDKGGKGVATLGGLTQIARSATGSPEQAANSVEATLRQLVAKAPDLKGEGVNVFDKSGKARDIQDVLVETISKVGGKDIEKKKVGLQKVFGEEGIRAISPLITAFADATAQGKDGVQALRDKLRDAIEVTGSWKDVQADAALAQEAESAKLSTAWQILTSKVGDQVVPGLVRLVEKFTANDKALDALAGTAGVLMSGFEAFIDLLASLPGLSGLFKRPEKTPAQKVDEAKKRLDEFDSNRPFVSMADDVSDGVGKQRAALLASLARAKEEHMPAAPLGSGVGAGLPLSDEEYYRRSGGRSNAAAALGPLSSEEYERQMSEAGGGTLGMLGRAGKDAGLKALLGPLGLIGASGLQAAEAFGGKGPLDTDEQAKIREKQSVAVGGQAVFDATRANKAADELASKFNLVATAADKIGRTRGDPLGG